MQETILEIGRQYPSHPVYTVHIVRLFVPEQKVIQKSASLLILSACPAVLLLLFSCTLGGLDYYNDDGGGDAYYDDYLSSNEEPLAPVSIVPLGGSFLIECPAAGQLHHNGEAVDMREVNWRPGSGGSSGGYVLERAQLTHSGTWSCSANPQASM